MFQAAATYAGGVAMMGGGSCGAYVSGALIIVDRIGRVKSDFSDPVRVRFFSYALAKEYHHRFIDCCGSVTYRDIQMKLFVRSCHLLDNDNYVKFEEAGGHRDKQLKVVGDTAL